MDFFDAVKNRRSIRSFKAQEVPADFLAKMLDAARLAPSALNEQPWEFVVIADQVKKKQIRVLYDAARSKFTLYKQDTSFLENATLILACTKSDATRDIISVALATENLLLAATALGLGSLVMTTPVSTEEQVSFFRRECNLPAGIIPLALIAVGYSTASSSQKESGMQGMRELSMTAVIENFSNRRNANRRSATTVGELCCNSSIQSATTVGELCCNSSIQSANRSIQKRTLESIMHSEKF